MKVTYAIGDIHGRAGELKTLLEMIKEDMRQYAAGTNFRLIQMGDMIDRGPCSCEVVEICRNLPDSFPQTEVLALVGNHEHELIDIYKGSADNVPVWFPLEQGKGGGVATLQSYGCEVEGLTIDEPHNIVRKVQQYISREHIDYFSSLPAFIMDDVYLFAHSGIVPGVALAEQNSRDFIALYGAKRNTFMESTLDHGRIVVHAHTPRRGGEVLPNRVNTDAGAGYNLHLQCTVLPEVYNMAEVRQLQVKIAAPENWLEPVKFPL